MTNNNYGGNGGLVVQNQTFDIQAYVKNDLNLGPSLVPTLQQINNIGFRKSQIESLLTIPRISNVRSQHSATKLKFFLEAILSNIDEAELGNAASDYDRFKKFQEEIQEVEEFREELKAITSFSFSYNECFELTRIMTPDEILCSFSKIQEEGGYYLSDKYQLIRLVREGAETGLDPQAVQEIRCQLGFGGMDTEYAEYDFTRP
jgi:hypothetical protein